MMRKSSSVKFSGRQSGSTKDRSIASVLSLSCRPRRFGRDHNVSRARACGCSSGTVQSRSPSGYYGPRLVGSRNRKLNSRESALGSSRIVASWYGPGYKGRRTANGENFDPQGFSAASKTLPLDPLCESQTSKTGVGWMSGSTIAVRRPRSEYRSLARCGKEDRVDRKRCGSCQGHSISNQAEAKVTH